MFTFNTNERGARYLIRGYFTGDGQHWFTIFDQRAADYLKGPDGAYPVLFRSAGEALEYGRHQITDFS